MSYFPSSDPLAQGMDPQGILDFIKETERNGLELHRLMIIRHGFCVASGSWYPYQEEDMHPLYSFSKSLTATAIGFLVQEGRLQLKDRLIDIFPELVPEIAEIDREGVPAHISSEQLYEHLQHITIHHLLTMSCGHEYEITDKSADWLKSFFRHPVIYEPGTFYRYNTAGSNALSAVIKRITGEDLTDYLRPRLFDPLGIGPATCECLPDAQHTQMGGSGFRLRLEDMARFTYFMLQKGYWEGQAILPGWYEIAGSKQIETAGDSEGHVKEWACGYGYQCWMGSLPSSFRADGAFGQFGFVFPTLDLIVITNAATEQTQSMVDAMYRHLIPAIHEDRAAAQAAGAVDMDLTDYMKGLKLPAMRYSRNPTAERWLEGRVYHLCPQEGSEETPAESDSVIASIPQTTGSPVLSSACELEEYPRRGLNPDRAQGSMLGRYGCSGLETIIGGTGLRRVADNSNIESMYFTFTQDSVIWHVNEAGQPNQIEASFCDTFCRKEGMLAGKSLVIAASAGWRSQDVLEMEIRRMDAGSGVRLLFRFRAKTLQIEADETLITDGGLGMLPKRLAAFSCG